MTYPLAWPWLHRHSLRGQAQVLSPLGKQVSYSWLLVYYVLESVASVGHSIKQIFQLGKRRFVGMLVVAAISDVEVLTALDAQAFAVQVMDRADGHFQ